MNFYHQYLWRLALFPFSVGTLSSDPLTKPKSSWKCCPGKASGRWISWRKLSHSSSSSFSLKCGGGGLQVCFWFILLLDPRLLCFPLSLVVSLPEIHYGRCQNALPLSCGTPSKHWCCCSMTHVPGCTNRWCHNSHFAASDNLLIARQEGSSPFVARSKNVCECWW